MINISLLTFLLSKDELIKKVGDEAHVEEEASEEILLFIGISTDIPFTSRLHSTYSSRIFFETVKGFGECPINHHCQKSVVFILHP